MSNAELQNELARLRAENEALKKARLASGKLTIKVSDKGAVSVYGMGRFPVTLYKEQWEKLLAHKTEIETFIQANLDSLATKETTSTEKETTSAPNSASTIVNTPNGQITTTSPNPAPNSAPTGGSSSSTVVSDLSDVPF